MTGPLWRNRLNGEDVRPKPRFSLQYHERRFGWELMSVLGATQVAVPQRKAPSAFILSSEKLSVNAEYERDF